MKKKVFNLFMILAAAAMMFTACKKEYSEPPIQVLPVGTVYTIGEILELEPGTVFTEDASVYGIITADEQSGNLYKCAFMQDRATGKAIELYLNAVSGVRIGDSVRIYLKDVTYSVYNNLPQLSNFEADGHIIILANDKPIQPALTTIADINAGHYLAGLVRLENVKFTEQNTFAEPTTYGNRTLIDPSNPASNVIVRTSNYANFAYDSLPQGTGNLIAIASVYNSTWQLYIRSASELEFNGYTPGGGGGDISLPYYQDFSSSFGTYTTYNVEGPQTFEIDYNTAKMSGYANGTNYANEDWLISSPVALVDVDHVKVGVNYVAQYQTSNSEDVTLQISKDYVAGTDPNDATWKKMDATYPNTSGWSDFQTVETSLDEFLGETVTVAIKFTSTETQSRTLEVKYILVEEGEPGGVTPPTPPTPGQGEGSGTADDPYNVAAGIALQSEEPFAWVHGIIVGAVKSGISSVGGNDDINWTGPFDLATNVVIADDASCREISQCIIVNLPAGKPLRTQVNLVDNPGNLGKHLAVNGKLRKYFGQAGLRDSGGTEADFVLEGSEPPTPGTSIFAETFASGQGSFTIQDVVLPDGLTFVWQHAPSYSCMKASAYVGQAYATESWLVSPAIDLSGVSSASLSLEQAVNYASPQGALSVMISTNYNGDVTTAIWEELSLSQWPSGNNWTFINSTTNLTPFVGQTVNIAFKYTSTTSSSATWEVKNFVVE